MYSRFWTPMWCTTQSTWAGGSTLCGRTSGCSFGAVALSGATGYPRRGWRDRWCTAGSPTTATSATVRTSTAPLCLCRLRTSLCPLPRPASRTSAQKSDPRPHRCLTELNPTPRPLPRVTSTTLSLAVHTSDFACWQMFSWAKESKAGFYTAAGQRSKLYLWMEIFSFSVESPQKKPLNLVIFYFG